MDNLVLIISDQHIWFMLGAGVEQHSVAIMANVRQGWDVVNLPGLIVLIMDKTRINNNNHEVFIIA